MSQKAKTDILKAMFITVIILSNLLGIKVTSLAGISVSVGIFMVPVAFLITDILEEVHGKKEVQELIFTTIITLVLTFAYVALCVALKPHERFTINQEYTMVFGTTLRMIIASLIAFLLSQTHDVIAFDYLKKLTKGKHLWLRNNLSTMISQFIDTVVFMFIAFYAIAPKFTFGFIWQMIIPYYIFKVIFAALDTPLCYAGVAWLKKGSKSSEQT